MSARALSGAFSFSDLTGGDEYKPEGRPDQEECSPQGPAFTLSQGYILQVSSLVLAAVEAARGEPLKGAD